MNSDGFSDYGKIFEFYSQRGIGRRMGFGVKPAILVVDFSRAFTDPSSPLGTDLDSAVASSCVILDIAREVNIPIVFTTVYYQIDGKDAGIWPLKAPAALTLIGGSNLVDLDPRLKRRDNEPIIVKKFASSFFGTNLVNLLISQRIDTLIIMGCTTSGCVRATAIDSLQYGFHTIIPKECVGDRSEIPHIANLFDIDMKYGDVIDIDEVVDYLHKLKL
jgi:maleamate amidohydrolase